MDEENQKRLLSEERTNNIIYDNEGNEAFRLSFTKRDYEDAQGAEFFETNADSFVSSDGSLLSFGDISRPQSQGGIAIQICSQCQLQLQRSFSKRRAIPFSPAAKMRSCFFCRAILCSKHYYIFQNHIVCKSCRNKQFILHRIIKSLFFRQVKGT
jgi:hypothetical protein